MAIVEGSIPRNAIRHTVVAGGAAGAHAISGIKPRDELVSVLRYVGAGTDVTDIVDLTSEFAIPAAGAIDNTGGTDTTGDKLSVMYLSFG